MEEFFGTKRLSRLKLAISILEIGPYRVRLFAFPEIATTFEV